MTTSLYFTHPEFLFLLIAVPILAVTHYYLFKFTKKKAMLFSNLETLKRVTGKKVVTRNWGILVMRMFTIIAVILALSQPIVWFDGEALRTDYILAIDTSASMTATDLSPTRLDAAKLAANSFIENQNATANIGLVSFSGNPVIEQLPTTDEESVTKAIDSLRIQTASGTDIPGAIIAGTNALLSGTKGRAIILFTDGSTTTGGATDDALRTAVGYAKDHQVLVHAVGMGTPDSSPTGYLPRLYNVSAVYSLEDLEFITEQTGGVLVEARNDAQLQEAFSTIGVETHSTFQSRNLVFGLLLFALLLLFIEWGLINTRFRLIP